MLTYKDSGLKVVNKVKPDLILLDLNLRDIKYLNYAQIFKSLLAGNALIMGFSSINYKTRAISNGSDDVRPKPLDYGNFKESLLRLFMR